MTMPQHTMNELRTMVAESDLRPDARAQADRLLSQDALSPEDVRTLGTLIQGDIDADFAEMEGLETLVTEDPGYQAFVSAREAELAQIEAEIAAVRTDAEDTGALLADFGSTLTDMETDVSISEVKARLKIEE